MWRKKPSDLQFLDETISEFIDLIDNGIDVRNTQYMVFLSCVVCDAPARSMIKCTKLYSGYYGCDKCEQRGVYLEGKVTFPSSENIQLRSDTSFRSKSNTEHHHAESPFCRLPIDMVRNFPVDYMHQTCLGVMKRLIQVWMRGKRQLRLSSHQKDLISSRLIKLQRHIPSFFARKPRALDDIEYWKASEYRQFLLYTGRIVLKGVLSTPLYSNFMILSVAICILVSKRLNNQRNAKARVLLSTFLRQVSTLYGAEFMVYNVHCLSHLGDDAVEFASLDNCSAFPFESYLQYLKKKIRSSRRPLVQISRISKEPIQLWL